MAYSRRRDTTTTFGVGEATAKGPFPGVPFFSHTKTTTHSSRSDQQSWSSGSPQPREAPGKRRAESKTKRERARHGMAARRIWVTPTPPLCARLVSRPQVRAPCKPRPKTGQKRLSPRPHTRKAEKEEMRGAKLGERKSTASRPHPAGDKGKLEDAARRIDLMAGTRANDHALPNPIDSSPARRF